MARTVTLASMRTQIRQRADIGLSSTGYITDAELNGYINASIPELQDLLISSFGDNYLIAPILSLTTTIGQTIYPLPDGVLYSAAPSFLKMYAVDIATDPSNTRFITVRSFMNYERNNYSTVLTSAYTGNWFTNIRYRVLGNNLQFIPTAGPAPLTVNLTYIPSAPVLVNDGDTFDGFNGWEEYVLTDCVLKCKAKNESDLQFEMKAKEDLIERINRASKNRDAGEPMRVVDRYMDGAGFGGPFSGFGGPY